MRFSRLEELYRILWTDRRVKVLLNSLVELSNNFRTNPAWRSTRARVANQISIDPDSFALRLASRHESPTEICLQQIVHSVRSDLISGSDHIGAGKLSAKGEGKQAIMIDALWMLQKLGRLAEDVRGEIEAEVQAAIEAWPSTPENSN